MIARTETLPRVDDDLRALIPPLAPQELAVLEGSIVADGLRDAIVVWPDKNVIADGHHRFAICDRHNIPMRFDFETLAGKTRFEVVDWMCRNQLGRRNLNEMQSSRLRGTQYENEKAAHGTNRYTKSPQNEDSSGDGRTCERLAKDHGVSRATIERDAELSRALDTLDEVGVDTHVELTSGKRKVKKADVIQLGKIAAEDPEKAKRVWQNVVENDERTLAIKSAIRAVEFDAVMRDFDPGSDVLESWRHGRWEDHVDALDDESVALVLTDPPYGMAYRSNFRSRRHDEIVGDGDETDAMRAAEEMAQAMMPKLKTDAHFMCFCRGAREWSILAERLESVGYHVKGELVWIKNNTGMGDLVGSFAPQFEMIVHAAKGKPTLYRRESNVQMADRVSTDRHPTEKPTALLQTLIEATTAAGELVVDPFGGVASTLVAAIECGRRAWGCEVDETYHRYGARRLAEAMEVAVGAA